MNAGEIRNCPILREDGPYGGGDAEPAIAFFLREIAAQLATLNNAVERGVSALEGLERHV